MKKVHIPWSHGAQKATNSEGHDCGAIARRNMVWDFIDVELVCDFSDGA